MGNQQPSTFEDQVKFLAINAKFGDGQLWKHPEARNYKIIYTSTTPELLEVKRSLAPNLFTTGVKPYETKHHKGRYANSKQMYRLASVTHPIITEIASTPKEFLIKELELAHIALWYLDDGCAIKRNDANDSYRISLAIGDTCNTIPKLEIMMSHLKNLFGDKIGRITKNNSKATENNKSWIIPKPIAVLIIQEARNYGVLEHKLPSW